MSLTAKQQSSMAQTSKLNSGSGYTDIPVSRRNSSLILLFSLKRKYYVFSLNAILKALHIPTGDV